VTITRRAQAVLALVLVTSCAGTPRVPPAALADLAPTGTLRAGINFGNVLLTGKDAASGEPRGIVVDLARELGRRLGVPVQIVAFDAAGDMADAAKSGAWDVAFLGAEPQRAGEISFTAAYAEIESTYLVPPDSPMQSVADLDRAGVRIAVPAKTAYDLYLSRSLQHARLERAAGTDAAFKLFIDERLDAFAGLRPVLITYAGKLPGSRVLGDRFSTVQQAIGVPQGRDAGVTYLRTFVEDIKATGLVARTIDRNGIRGLSVPAAVAAQ